ncbi:hypothetical protein BC835DRAFT_1060203 [Cytidiella melzeri]|nr:hypothetical protein BC835DRAFT_1060203 [Cytidiella melzeri]
MAPTLAALETQFDTLSIKSVVFAALSAMFGAYVVLSILAIWATYQRQGVAYKRLRIITVLLFVVLLIHYISRAIVTGRARRMSPAPDEEARFTVPLQFVTATTATIAAFIFDSLLVWRFYVIYGRPRWALYLPAAVVSTNAVLGLIADFINFSYYSTPALYLSHLDSVSFKLSAVWGWCMFATNTVMTGAIIGRIVYVSRMSRSPSVTQYGVLLEAITESAAVTWVGLLFYEIASTAPTHGITTKMNIGYVMICVLPVFFGISHCLITVRLGLSGNAQTTFHSSNNGLPSITSKFQAREITVTMTSQSESSSDVPMTFAEKEVAESTVRE